MLGGREFRTRKGGWKGSQESRRASWHVDIRGLVDGDVIAIKAEVAEGMIDSNYV